MTPRNLTKEQFKEILGRYSKGQSLPHEERFIEQWYEALGNESRAHLNVEQQKEIEDKLWNAISLKIQGQQKQSDPKQVDRFNFNYWRTAGIAAAVLLAFSALLYFGLAKNTIIDSGLAILPDQADEEMVSEANQSRLVVLKDGTRVTLKPHSKLRVKNFSKVEKREVFLEGEAFFEVAHDKAHPFFVYTGEITTKVLGTSFTINARDLKKSIEVSVKTGRVSVTKTQQKSSSPLHILTEEIILTPNQKAIYDGSDVMAALVEKPRRITGEGNQLLMQFDEEPVPSILTAIEEAYGVDIVFDEELLSQCLLTTTLSDEDLYDRLNIICKAIHGSYELNGTLIIIKSKGCIVH